MSDWGDGRYELTAERLEPAAHVAVDAIEPTAGMRVLDVACGTGNAALLAARRGALAAGVDAAPRLVEVARDRARREGLDAEFAVGDATALPYDDDAFDAAVSVFGVIFADPGPAAAELLRVVRPGGRIVVTTWVPGGAAGRFGEVVRAALGAPPEPPRWSDNRFVEQLFAPHRVRFERHAIAFTAPSAADYFDEQAEHHPLSLAARAALERAGKAEEVEERLRQIFEDANEDPAAFRITSEYDVVTVEA